MKTIAALTTIGSLLASAVQAETLHFDDATPGAAPPGWTATKTGSGQAKWTIEKDDQAGGVIWRCKDADNYYVARANALEDNVTIYHTIQGKRVSFKNVNTPVKSGEWHALRVEFAGTKFKVTLDGKSVIEATDDSIADAGKVGVWTKADSVTLFDDFNCGAK